MNVTPNIQFPINFLSLSRYWDFTYKQFAYYPTKGQLDLFNNCRECFRSFTSSVLAGTRRIKKRKKKEKKENILTELNYQSMTTVSDKDNEISVAKPTQRSRSTIIR